MHVTQGKKAAFSGQSMNLDNLYKILKKRQKMTPKQSYTVSLLKKGEDAILQKIGEEATEVIIAAKSKNQKNIIAEIADLYFMTLVLMLKKGISPGMIYEELKKRNNSKVKIIGKS